MKFKSSDYNDYNKKYNYYKYAYLHHLLDLLYKLRKYYKLSDNRLYYWDEDEKQAEFLPSMYLDIEQRILIHKYFFKALWQQRHKNVKKQLKLFDTLTL